MEGEEMEGGGRERIVGRGKLKLEGGNWAG